MMRATALASEAGRALSGNIRSLMEMIANSLMARTTTIALASGVGGLAAAAAKAAREEKIAAKTQSLRPAHPALSLATVAWGDLSRR
jgi:hypothetical protein